MSVTGVLSVTLLLLHKCYGEVGMAEKEEKKGFLKRIRYWLAPREVFMSIDELKEEVRRVRQEHIDTRVAHEADKKYYSRLLEDKESLIGELQRTIKALEEEKRGLQEDSKKVREDATIILKEEEKEQKTKNVLELLNPRERIMFRVLAEAEHTYEDLMKRMNEADQQIKNMPTLRVMVGRMEKKLSGTKYQLDKINQGKEFYLKIK